MSLFSPARYQPPYYPFQRQPAGVQAFTAFERVIKSALFSCRMCGNCLLQETAFICPMTCPKGLRNGPCGGSTVEHCEVDPSRPCTWYLIYQRAERMGRLDTLLEIQAPIDGNQAGHETWLDVIRHATSGKYTLSLADVFDTEKRSAVWDQFFYDLRQPDWWKGDAEYHPPASMEPVSELQANLQSGRFTITSEIAPPLTVSTGAMMRKVELLKPLVAAANFTDNASALPRMSSLASAHLCLEGGLEPVLQLQARDRDRYALQSEAVGAYAMGIRNVLCLSGDHMSLGPAPAPAPAQNDMDAIQLLWMLRRMRDEGLYLDGRNMKNPPQFFLGAAASPYAALPAYEAIREEKKINAGAQFFQTQPIFDHGRFLDWLEALDKRNLLGKTYILAGIIPLKSAKAAHFMADDVPGVFIPEALVKRMDDAADQQEEGVAIALELIERLKATPGVGGLHIMAVHWEEIVPRLIEEGHLPLPLRAEAQAEPVAPEAQS
jgi:methylenetetrahydrofolate reductase (NADPH)